MLKRLLVFIVLHVSGLSISFGQTIEDIQWKGTSRTDTAFLEQLLISRTGDTLREDLVNEDLRFLRSLAVFSEVNFRTSADSNRSIILEIHARESHTILPTVGFGTIGENTNLQLGLQDYHVFGRFIQASLLYTWYDRHSFQFNTFLPYLLRGRFGLYVGMEKRSTLEPVYADDLRLNYLTDRVVAEIMPGYHPNRHSYVQIGGARLWENYEVEDSAILQDTDLPAEVTTGKWLYKAAGGMDYRQYHRHQVSGWVINLSVEHVSSPTDSVPFNKFFSEGKWYLMNEKGNYAGRMRVGISTQSDTPFPPFVIDSYVNIRGAGNRISRGTAEFVLNQEYRYDVWSRPNWIVQVAGFSDAGVLRPAASAEEPGFELGQAEWFTGAGVRLCLPNWLNLVLRADVAVSPLDTSRKGVVIGIGQYY